MTTAPGQTPPRTAPAEHGVRHSARAYAALYAPVYAPVYARLALGAAFLSGVASRFGWWGRGVGYGDFTHLLAYTARVNRFMPVWTIPFLGWAATAAELALGLLLVAGLWRRPVALASAALLALFGLAMAVSFGPKEPLDYSVFSASAAALLLAHYAAPARVRRPA